MREITRWLAQWLGAGRSGQEDVEAEVPEAVAEIAAVLEQLEPAAARSAAALAFMFSRVARADLTIGPEEQRAMERLLRERAGLSAAEARAAVAMAARRQELFGGTDNFLVTRALARAASRQEKLRLLESLFAVCAADSSVTSVEEREIRQIASELGLSHRDYVAVRVKFRDSLAVLRRQPRR